MILLFVIIQAAPLSNIIAQDQSIHEFFISGGVGQAGLKYDIAGGDVKQKIGGSFGLGYSYFFNEFFSVNTGLELSLYRSKANIKSFSEELNAIDNTNQGFKLTSDIRDYKEKQHSFLLNIPVMAQFQAPVSGENLFYLAAGFKLGIPVSSRYTSYAYNLDASATYSSVNGTGEDQVNDLGTYSVGKKRKSLRLDAAFMLAAEIGMKWELSFDHSLYTGFFIDYGLNDIRKKTDMPFLIYDGANPDIYTNNSIVNSKLSDKFTPMAIGLKVRLAFKFD